MGKRESKREGNNLISSYFELLRAYLNYKLRHRPNRGPVRLIMNVTGACQSLCKTCNWGRNYLGGEYKTKDELTLAEYSTLFKTAPSLLWITIGGGEPTMRRDLAEVILSAEENCPKLMGIDYCTNGLSLPAEKRVVEKLMSESKRIKLELAVSLDGSRELHNDIRGQDNYDKSIEVYKYLREVSKSNQRIHPHINYTLSGLNAGRMENFFDSLSEEDLNVSTQDVAICIASSGTTFSNVQGTGTDFEISRRQYYFAKRDLEYYRNKTRSETQFSPVQIGRKTISRIFTKLAIERYLLDPRKVVTPCAALFFTLFLSANGDVFPCTLFCERVTNVRDNNCDMGIVWRNMATDAMRAKILSAGCLCRGWSGCDTSQSIIVGLPGLLKYS